MYLLIFYVPLSHLEKVKNALFAKGAGRYEKYDRCSWEVSGTGQFRPLPGSNPFSGKVGNNKKIDEYRVEMICKENILKDVINELISVHPYEEPVYHIIEVKNI